MLQLPHACFGPGVCVCMHCPSSQPRPALHRSPLLSSCFTSGPGLRLQPESRKSASLKTNSHAKTKGSASLPHSGRASDSHHTLSQVHNRKEWASSLTAHATRLISFRPSFNQWHCVIHSMHRQDNGSPSTAYSSFQYGWSKTIQFSGFKNILKNTLNSTSFSKIFKFSVKKVFISL